MVEATEPVISSSRVEVLSSDSESECMGAACLFISSASEPDEWDDGVPAHVKVKTGNFRYRNLHVSIKL